MAVWRRKPADKVLVHSDQGSQFTSLEWASFPKHHNLEHSPLGDALHHLPGNTWAAVETVMTMPSPRVSSIC